jgi:lysophospholipase
MNHLTRLVASLFLFLTCPAFAISEIDYAAHFTAEVMPFYESAGISGTFGGAAGVPISYRTFETPNEKGAIVFAPGRAESYLKYAELEFDLARAGYSVYVIDHRGQGFSGRMTDDSQVGFVESYENYVTDLKTFVDRVVNATPHPHHFLLTNSMGGAIGALYLAKYPVDFERATMSVPMLEINTHRYPEPVAYSLAAFETFIGHGEQYAPGETPYDPSRQPQCSTSSTGKQQRACVVNTQLEAHPEIITGGASYKWVFESLKATREIRAGLGRQIQTPVLIFQAGKDELVRPEGQDTFCSQAVHCQKLEFADATHAILAEKDSVRELAIAAMLDFFGGAR